MKKLYLFVFWILLSSAIPLFSQVSIGGGFDFKVGGFYQNFTSALKTRWSDRGADADDRGSLWGLGIRFAAFGAAIDVTAAGAAG